MSSLIRVPSRLSQTLADVHGELGVRWLRDLPQRVAIFAEHRGLSVGPPLEPLFYSYVATAVLPDGSPAILKATVPTPELGHEVGALRVFDGQGAVRLIDAQLEQGILLLERLEPGVALTALHDDELATSIAADLMRQIGKPIASESPFPTVSDWASELCDLRNRFGGTTGPFPKPLVEAAESLFADLLASQSVSVLLHGDLHHGNILAATRSPWLAIDPKGVVGEAAFEVGAFLRNPMPDLLRLPQPKRVLSRRLDQLSEELGLDRSRLLGWGLAQSVLAGWWSFEDHDADWEPWLQCAALLSDLRRGAA